MKSAENHDVYLPKSWGIFLKSLRSAGEEWEALMMDEMDDDERSDVYLSKSVGEECRVLRRMMHNYPRAGAYS